METPYYAVIFTSELNDVEDDSYREMSDIMVGLAKKQEGFLGIESARNEIGITISYWKDEASILNWKQQVDHLEAQKLGRSKWYKNYKVRIAKVERAYEF